MYIVHVHIRVQPESIEEFKVVSLENARKSIQEPGVARFDMLQQSDDPTHFELIEVYRTPQDQANHKETAHYNKWREFAEPMLAEARTRTVYTNIFPADQDW
jgi:autoinducer 2-degrading protein